MSHSFLHYDVFTDQPLTGNQLAVFPDAGDLSTERMQALAREMNFSESTFVLPVEQPGTDARVRIFTPGVEMAMAGHPTIGTAFALAATGAIRPGTSNVVFGLNIGPTPVDLMWEDSHLRFAWMTQQAPVFGPPLLDRTIPAAALGLAESDLAPSLPVQRVSCGVPFLFVPLRDPETVDRAVSTPAALAPLAETDEGGLPVFLFALSPQSAEETVYSRMFARGFGIAEDPATGSASGPLGCYLVQHGVVSPATAGRILSVQGVKMQRPSRIHVAIGGRPDAITSVKVGGSAVLVGRGELLV